MMYKNRIAWIIILISFISIVTFIPVIFASKVVKAKIVNKEGVGTGEQNKFHNNKNVSEKLYDSNITKFPNIEFPSKTVTVRIDDMINIKDVSNNSKNVGEVGIKKIEIVKEIPKILNNDSSRKVIIKNRTMRKLVIKYAVQNKTILKKILKYNETKTEFFKELKNNYALKEEFIRNKSLLSIILPKKVRERVKYGIVENITIKDENKTRLVIKVKVQRKLFGVIPVNITEEIETEGEKIVKVNRPWWWFLTF